MKGLFFSSYSFRDENLSRYDDCKFVAMFK